MAISSPSRRYSFCVPPKLDLRVRPKLGEREVTFCHVTEWIEKKLQDEFQVQKNYKKCVMVSSSRLPPLLSLSCVFRAFPESFCAAKHGRHLLTPDALGGGQPSSLAASVLSVPAVPELLHGVHREDPSRGLQGRVGLVPRCLITEGELTSPQNRYSQREIRGGTGCNITICLYRPRYLLGRLTKPRSVRAGNFLKV